jgi:hypothetical protein
MRARHYSQGLVLKCLLAFASISLLPSAALADCADDNPPDCSYIAVGAGSAVTLSTAAASIPGASAVLGVGFTPDCEVITNATCPDQIMVPYLSEEEWTSFVSDHEACATLARCPVAVVGACGSANGVSVTSAPTSNLCSAGTASAVSGSGPWAWTCAGSGGGSTASCSANPGSCPAGDIAFGVINGNIHGVVAYNAIPYGQSVQVPWGGYQSGHGTCAIPGICDFDSLTLFGQTATVYCSNGSTPVTLSGDAPNALRSNVSVTLPAGRAVITSEGSFVCNSVGCIAWPCSPTNAVCRSLGYYISFFH